MNVDAFFVGVESGNQRLLNIMNKGITTEQIINTHELAKKYKIKIEAFMLMSIPTQTIKEMHEDFKFSTMLMKKYNSIIDYSIMYCYPNTPLFNYAKEKFPNKFDIKDWSLERHKWRFPNVPLYIEEGHNADELIALYKSFRFKINRMSIPKHKLPLLSAKYIARNLYRKTMHTFNKDFITGKR